MKICPKCGAQMSDDRQYCIDCGTRLGKSLPKEEEKEIEEAAERKVDRLYNQSDPLYISTADRVFGLISAAGAVVALIFLFLQTGRFDEILYSFILFLCSIVSALFPNVLWELEKIRLCFTISDADDAEPSAFYLWARKVTIYGCLIFAWILFLFGICQ